MKKEIITRDKFYAFIYCVFISFIFLLIFSISSSPLYTFPFTHDSGIFQIIGKEWMNGLVPYRDIWDNKGPLLYFANGLGYLMTGNKIGIFIIQHINLSIAIFILFRLFRLEFSFYKSLFFSSFILIWLSNTIYNNSVGEYILIPLNLSYYFLYKWLKSFTISKANHPYSYSIVYGITLGFGFLLRLTDVLTLFMTLIVISIYILSFRQWANWVINFLICLSSFIISIIPFIIYFFTKGAFDDFWYATISHNFEYLSQSEFKSYYWYGIGSFSLSFANYIGIILGGILVLLFNKKRKYFAISWIVPSLTMLFLLFNSYASGNYAISSMPFFCFVVIELSHLHYNRKSSVYPLILYLFGGLLSSGFIYQLWQTKTRDSKPNPMIGLYKKVEHTIPIEERNLFIAYNCKADIYYYTSLRPCYPYFITMQHYLNSDKDSLRKKIINAYKTRKAKWILVRYPTYPNFIKGILNRYYDVEMNFPREEFSLYHIKEGRCATTVRDATL